MAEKTSTKTVWLLYGVALVFRLVYLAEYRGLLEFLHPTVDALYHHLTALAISDGALVSSEPFFRAPFYNYFLGFVYWITGDSIAAARLIQLLLGAWTVPLTYLIAEQLFDRRTAVVAAILVLLTSDMVYFDGELLLESSVVLMTLFVIWASLRYRETSSVTFLVLASLVQGLAVVNRPNTLLFVPLLIWIVWRPLKDKLRAQEMLLLCLGVLAPIAAVVAHNATRAEPAVTIATQGGINFYLGNNAEADGVSAVMPGKLGYAWQYADIKHLAETETGAELSPGEVSSYYFGEGWRFIASHPLDWLALLVKKVYLLFSGDDISNNRNLPFFKSQTMVLKLLPIGMGVLVPLGLVGMWLCRRKSSIVAMLAISALTYGLSFVAFFVNSRFRLPMLPLLAVFAAAALIELWELRRAGSARQIALPAVSIVLLAVLLNSNPYGLQFDNRQQAHFSRGNLLLDAGRTSEAINEYHAALSSEPPLLQANLNLGLAFLRLGQFDSAWHYFLIEDSLASGSAEAMNNLAYMYRQTQQYTEAIVAAEAALELKPYLSEARLNLWYSLRESGRGDSAAILIGEYERGHRLTNAESFIAAVVEADLGDLVKSERRLRKLLGELESNEVPSYSEASNISRTSDVLAPAMFESRVTYNLGFVLGSKGELDSAVVYLQRAVQLDPQLSEGWTNLGSAYFALKRYSDAIDALERSLALGTQTEIVTFNLALSHLALADTSSGLRYLQQSLDLRPGFAPAQALLNALTGSK